MKTEIKKTSILKTRAVISTPFVFSVITMCVTLRTTARLIATSKHKKTHSMTMTLKHLITPVHFKLNLFQQKKLQRIMKLHITIRLTCTLRG